MDDSFRFKQFTLRNRDSALKLGTDAVLLGASMSLYSTDRRALDIGTGTGVIALMAAQRSPNLYIDAIEIDELSAQEARYNFVQSPWSDRLRVECIALQDYYPTYYYDLIFSNPPYYDNSLRNLDHRQSNARHEENLSLSVICAFCDQHLSPEGRMSLILPYDRCAKLTRLAASFGLHLFRSIEIRTTSSKIAKRAIMEFSRIKAQPYSSTLVLMEAGQRSEAYSKLTEDFYL